MIEATATVVNKLGIHTRAAAKLVNAANQFTAQIEIVRAEKRANAKSIMNVMMLAATHCTEVQLYVDGPDEEQAMAAILALFSGGFDEGAEPCP